MSKLTFAVIADTHLTKLQGTSQYAAFHWAIEDVNLRKPDFAVIAGDLTAYGDMEAITFFKEKTAQIQVPYKAVLGNADLRTEANIPEAMTMCSKGVFEHEGRRIVCVNSADGHIYEDDRAEILKSGDGDILIMHHNIEPLDEETRDFLTNWAAANRGLMIHGHKHKDMDYMVGQTRCIGIRCLDPDKSIVKGPCFVYVTIEDEKVQVEERCFSFSHDNVRDFRENLGISCFDIYQDIDFAIQNHLKNIEIRKFTGSDEELEFLKEKVLQWRRQGGEIVSVHMPNQIWNGREIEGLDVWNGALRIAREVKAEAVTVHPPRRVRIGDMTCGSETWNQCLRYFAERVKELPLTTRIGMENMHSLEGEKDDEDRFFGYKPDEILAFVEALNQPYGYDRVGMVLDVGHARNNGPHFSKNVLSSWYKAVGQRTTAYHIHQTIQVDGKMVNHTAITNWNGAPCLCFISFLWAWQTNQINHCPMFMEMKTKENCMISLNAWNEYEAKYVRKS